MRKTVAVIAASALLAILPSSARAQDEKKIHVNFGGGPTFPAGDLGNHFNTGWGPAIGVTMDTGNPRFSLQFEYAYRYMGISKNAAVPAPLIVGNTFDANHQTNQLDFNLIANLSKPGAKARIYGLFGPGAYHRKVEITKYEGSGVICDPYWYVCGTYPVNSVIGSRGGWNPGFNIGGGVGIHISETAEFFIESRFHYVVGPDINDASATAQAIVPANGTSTTGYYWPLTFGFRF